MNVVDFVYTCTVLFVMDSRYVISSGQWEQQMFRED